ALVLWTSAALTLRRSSLSGPLLLGLCLCLGALRYQTATSLLPPHHIARLPLGAEERLWLGRLDDEPRLLADQVRCTVSLREVEVAGRRLPVTGRVRITAHRFPPAAAPGDSVAVRGVLRRPEPARNPGAFDYRAYLAEQGVHAVLSLRRPGQEVRVWPGTAGGLSRRVVVPARCAFRRALEANLTGAPAGLLEGMLLGDQERIAESVRDAFRVTGLAHALVISGMNIALVAALFLAILRLCRLSERAACGVTVAALALYALITGMQPPVVRAVIMADVVLAGRMLRRRSDVWNSLGLAALLIMVLWPVCLSGLSFQLSFGATLAIVGLYRPLGLLFPARWRDPASRRGRWVVLPLCVTVAAQLGTGPLIAHHFQQCAPVALPANLLVAPFLSASVWLGTLACLGGVCWTWLALPFNGCNYLVLKGLLLLVEGLARIPGASLTTPRPGWVAVAWMAALAVLGARLPGHPRARYAFAFLLLLGLNAAVWGHCLRPRVLEAVFLDVGQGDAVFLRFADGKTMLVDGGDRTPTFDYGERVLLPFLRQAGVRRLDVVVATHPHDDHIGGLVAVLEQMEVRHFLDSGQYCDTWTARRVRELVTQRGVRYRAVSRGDSLAGLGGAGILVLHPAAGFVSAEGEAPHGLNNASVVLRLTYGQFSLLLAGDAEEDSEPALLAWGDRLHSQVLKVAHHGSRTSSGAAFLEGVAPQYGVVSVGVGNRFGHPSAAVVGRYRERGVEVLRTDQRGAVLVRTDGRTVRLWALLPDPGT
ncbi:MAG: DNA internalization-related competence protein ComEC/Rec2, partial [Candidatus Latescibacterota bacterium]